MGKLSREKGKRGEREVAALYREYGFIDARRAQQFKGTKTSADIEGVPHHVEVKRRETCSPEKWLEQCESEAEPGKVPVVFHRKSGEEWKVTLRAKEFLALNVLVYNSANRR